jgi:hypothetical protein
VIRYEDPAYPPLPTEGLNLIIHFDAQGHACTSSRMVRGWQYTRYQYVAPGGASTELPGGLNWGRPGVQVWRVGSSGDYKEEYSFVGTEDEFNKSWYAKPGR